MNDPKLHELLNQAQFGDRLALAHSNGKHTASISGPVLTDQTHDPAVGIHLLDGDPHVVRNSTGVVWAPVVQAALYLADITAGRTVDLGSFAQPATAPPAARQGDSGHRDGGEAARPNLNAQTAPSIPTDLTASQGETGHEDQYETDFNRWLAGISPGQREQITRDIEAAHDLIRAEAWDEAVDTLSGPWEDMIPAQIVDLDRRNPYRKEQS